MTKFEILNRTAHIIQWAMESLDPETEAYRRDAVCLAYIERQIQAAHPDVQIIDPPPPPLQHIPILHNGARITPSGAQ